MQSLQSRSLIFLGGGVFLSALFFNMLQVFLKEPWLDEGITQYVVSRDWAVMIEDRIAIGHSPLYFMIVKFFSPISTSLELARSISAVANAGAVSILAVATARFCSRPAGWFVGVFCAVSPVLAITGAFARPYGLTMVFIALALYGAMALIARREDRDPRPHARHGALLAVGLSGATLTLTGGAIAALAIAVSPLLSGDLRRDRRFLRRWGFWLTFWLVAFIAMAVIVAAPHLLERAGGNSWSENVRPFSAWSLRQLLNDFVIGGAANAGPLAPALLSPTWSSAIVAAVTAVIAVFAVQGLLRARAHPVLAPAAMLAIGFTVVLLLASLSTSLLFARYFAPAWFGGAVLVGVGMASRPRLPAARGAHAALAVAVLGYFAVLVTTQSVHALDHRDQPAKTLAGIIAARGSESSVLIFERQDRTMLFETRLVYAASRWEMVILEPKTADVGASLERGAPVYLIETEAWSPSWSEPEAHPSLAAGAPAPTCVWRLEGRRMRYFGPPFSGGCGPAR